jgi:N-acetylmuramoyl-L-alanine amidase
MLPTTELNLRYKNQFFKFEKPMLVRLMNSFAKKRIFSVFLALCSVLLLNAQTTYELKTVVIDAGHGGKDPGAIGVTGVKEKDVALDVSLKLGEKIKATYPNVKVIYTRSTDVFIGLADRAKIANKSGADLFISIHANSAENKTAKGTESWVLGLHKSEAALEVAKRENASILMEEDYEAKYQDFDPRDPDSYIGLTLRQNAFLEQSLHLAKNIQDEFTTDLKRYNRGVKQAGFMVLYQTTMPSVLVELGFLSNPDDEKFMASKEGRENLAHSMFIAFVNYKSQIERVNMSMEGGNSSKDNTTKKEEVTVVQNTNSNLTDSVQFRVQIATSGTLLETVPQNFKGLKNIIVEKDGKYYKYFIGNFYTFAETEEQKKLAVERGYTTAFIVAYKNGKRITVSEALNGL